MEDIKEQIAEVFKKHFDHFGFKKTSVDEIAREMHISKKTIYKHFSTKEKIFYYIVSKVAVQQREKIEKDLAVFPTAEEKLKQFVMIKFSETKKILKAGNDAFEFRYKYEIAQQAFKEAYNVLIKKIIMEGVDRKEFKNNDIEMSIVFINGVFSESMRLLTSNQSLKIEDKVYEAIIKLIK